MGGLGERQGRINTEYYREKGAGIYSDFITYAGSEKLAYCNAREFYPLLAGKGGATVFEFGVGDGRFAREFLLALREMCKRDGKEELFGKARYALHDVSPKMLGAAKANLGEFGGITRLVKFDATKDEIGGHADYIRMNELLSDLPAEVFVLDDAGDVMKVKYGASGLETGREGARGEEEMIAKAVLRHFPSGYYVPINFSAGEFLVKAARALDDGGYMDIFDYGFANAGNLLPLGMWNPSIVREYGGQITVDLNFPYLLGLAKLHEFDASVELQREYVERILGQKVYSAELGEGLEYYAESGLKEGGKMEDKLGNYGEDDGFYHMRVRK